MDTLTRQSPTTEAAAALAATPAAELLTKAYQLTHQMHRAEGLATTRGYPDRAGARELTADLRAARDLISAELIRRAGE